MTLQLKPGTSWDETYARCVAVAPEAFAPDRLLNLIRGQWRRTGEPSEHRSPLDGSPIPGPPRVSATEAAE
ncbi:MAG: aldehyde dehydrogenase, partial [Streptosporangiaceae bacterium]